MTRCVVFAYHNVGVRCLSVLLDRHWDVALIVTHTDDPGEEVWFESVAELARMHQIPCITPDDANGARVLDRIRELAPDFIFSFYYRRMLAPQLLALARRGALNMHGSLLPKYRGRVPVNWAVIHGETETGATLHYMEEKPDSGAVVDQLAVPILENDTALDVFHKVTCAAEVVLHRSLPLLEQGSAPRIPQRLEAGSYFGGRRPQDGQIDWAATSEQIHNLVRALAPPYPGAFSTLAGRSLRILRTRLTREPARHPDAAPCFYCEDGRCYVDCTDNRRLQVLSLEIDTTGMSAEEFQSVYGRDPVRLGETS